jgi:hypothetical protein
MGQDNNPTNIIRATAKEFNYKSLLSQDEEGNIGKNNSSSSGATMYADFSRKNFVINGKKVEVLSNNEKEAINQNNNNRQKKDEYHLKKTLEEYSDLIDRTDPSTVNYRPAVKQIWQDMFKITNTTVPDDAIIEELITNCNQAGYDAFFSLKISSVEVISAFDPTMDRAIHPRYEQCITSIKCNDSKSVTIEIQQLITMYEKDKSMNIHIPSSVKFTIESTENGINYKNGEVSMSIPKDLQNITKENKTIFDIILELFQNLCEKLGFSTDIKIEHKLDPETNFSNSIPEGVQEKVKNNCLLQGQGCHLDENDNKITIATPPCNGKHQTQNYNTI